MSPGLAVAQPADVGVSASAQPDAEPAAEPQAIAYGALPGGLHVASAETLPQGAAEVELLSGFGYRKGLLGSDHRFGRAIGDVSGAFGILPMLSAGISLDGYYDKHFGFPSGGNSGCGADCDDGYVGNPHVYLRFAKQVGANSFGAQVGVWVPGNKAPSVELGATSVDLVALATLAAGPGKLSLDAGFRIDNSASSVDDIATLSLQDRISLGVSYYNELLAGAQYLMPAGNKGWVGLEGSLQDFLGSPPTGMADLAEGTLMLRGTITAGIHLNDQWGLTAYVDLVKSPGIEAAQAAAGSIPIIPYEPIITGGLSLNARFGGPKTRILEGPKPCWETAEGCKPDEKPLFGEVTGSVVDEAGKPLVGAKVTVKGHTYADIVSDTTRSDGTFDVKDVKVGRRVTTPSKAGPTTDEKIDETSLDVSVDLADRKPGTSTVDKPKAGANPLPGPITLQPALPPGQIKGVVRSATGTPIARATVTIQPGDRKAESAPDGTFAIDLPPGTYKVSIKAPGFATQELDVTIDPNSVALKEIVLHK
ncbi:MAG TPA: carboxypeptidase-like regulatory domain-containing protein [Kofleriaceae bacterium]|jgi:hypothetical protein